MQKKKNFILYQILILLGILVIVNLISTEYFARLDLTDDNRYTLSDATLNILDDIDQPVTVTAYFTEGLPPNYKESKRNFKDLLIEYSNYSDGMVNYEFINPNKDEQTKQQAVREGVRPVVIKVREKDQVKQQRAFMGAVIKKGSEKEAIPLLEQVQSMEYALSSKIKKLVRTKKPKVGVIQGHGEPSLSAMQQLQNSLSVLYDVQTVNLSDTTGLSEYRTLAWVAPQDSVPQSHFSKLEEYMRGQGNLLIAMNRVRGEFQRAQGLPVNTGLESWLAEKGIDVGSNFVLDKQSGSVAVTQKRGGFNVRRQIKFPYIPQVTNFSDHPITKGLEQVMLRFASSINFSGDTAAVDFNPIARSLDLSATKPAPLRFNVRKNWTKTDFPDQNIPLAATLEGNIIGNNFSRMVLISDGDFAVNGEGRRTQKQPEDNISLMVNSIDWLSDDTGLIELRTKGITSRPIKQLDDQTKTLLRWGNFFVPILLIVLYGLFRNQRNRNIRVKRMEEGYV
ncbi:MAG: Gldg family protein [Bacteroidales bacterium]|nr:Gldg family protein [Bacteroidales bacterium]MCF8333761.1 Gldg family protein [Bacteroidales bacterium]